MTQLDRQIYSVSMTAAFFIACGGQNKDATDAGAEAAAMPELALNEPHAEVAEGQTEEAEQNSSEASSPQFEPGMSVEEASNEAPFAVNAVEVPIEKLEAPLMSSLYTPCNIPGSQHYKVRVAVYQGKAVGIDVSTEPEN